MTTSSDLIMMAPQVPQMSFRRAMMAAVILHFIALVLYALEYKPQVIEVPFQALKLKIGQMYLPVSVAPHRKPQQRQVKAKPYRPAPSQAMVEVVPKSLQYKREHQQEVAPVPEPPTPPEPETPAIEVLRPVVMQPQQAATARYAQQPDPARVEVEAQPTPARPSTDDEVNRRAVNGAKGSVLGNKKLAENQPINYGAILSAWINKFQFYPERALKEGVYAEAIMRLYVDRDGTIYKYIFDKRTGYDYLDETVSTIINRANPAPAMPEKEGASGAWRISIVFDPKPTFEE